MQLVLKILSGRVKSADPDQTAPSGAVWSGSALFSHVIFQTFWYSNFRLFTVTILSPYRQYPILLWYIKFRVCWQRFVIVIFILLFGMIKMNLNMSVDDNIVLQWSWLQTDRLSVDAQYRGMSSNQVGDDVYSIDTPSSIEASFLARFP